MVSLVDILVTEDVVELSILAPSMPTLNLTVFSNLVDTSCLQLSELEC